MIREFGFPFVLFLPRGVSRRPSGLRLRIDRTMTGGESQRNPIKVLTKL